MTEMSNLIADAVARKLTPEFIEQEIDTRVGKLVVEAVDKALRSWSDTGKLIETAIENSLRVDRLDLPSYGSTVTAILKAQIKARVADLVAGRLAEDMDALLKLAPKTVKLSEIAAEMIRDRDGYGEVITVIAKRSEYGSTWLYLDEDEAYEEHHSHRAAVRLLVGKDGKIASATLDDRDINTTKVLGNRYGLPGERPRHACERRDGAGAHLDEGRSDPRETGRQAEAFAAAAACAGSRPRRAADR